MLCALGLIVVSPLATAKAIAASPAMPGCTMDGHMPAKPADHAKMDCCTPFCQVAPVAALVPELSPAGEPLKSDGARHDRAAVDELSSFTSSGLDPPPRLPF